MDQKCTPDVVYVLANCIFSLLDSKEKFTRKDLQESSEFSTHLTLFFGKPDPTDKRVYNEVDKVLSQPLKTLSYAGILSETRIGRDNVYHVLDKNAIARLASHESKCYEFLVKLNTKVLEASGQLYLFEKFRNSGHSQEEFDELKSKFFVFFKANSKLGTKGSDGLTEYRRIFPKILNPLATHWGTPGTIKGRVSKYPFVYQELHYNRPNFRDIGKRKNVPRDEVKLIAENREKFYKNEMSKVKRGVLEYHGKVSEVRDNLASGSATQAHHIFPVSRFPNLQSVRENIIALTASQHNQRAHPDNKTYMIDQEYQRLCLLSKLDSIGTSLSQGDSFYNKEMFLHTINEGWGLRLDPDLSLGALRIMINGYQFA